MNIEIKPQSVSVSISSPTGVTVGTGTPVVREYVERDPYEGTYQVTPSSETQVLETKYLRMTDNITINPIPSNYGLITQTGAGIRIT